MNFYSPLRTIIRKNVRNGGCFAYVSHNYSTKSKEQIASNSAVNNAEKVIGYPTSFLSLRWLLNDEVANIALHIRKLIGTNHPLLDAARDLIINKQSLSWGLIVLLISKAGGLNKEFSQVDCDITAGILHNQRVVAEITDMVRMSNIIHKTILNIQTSSEADFADLNFGNKLSLLTGDYLLSTSFGELNRLRNHNVNELISTCLRDLTEGQFIEPRDQQNRPLPAAPLKEQKDITIPNQVNNELLEIAEVLGNAKAEWTLRHLLDGASLLAKCCQATLLLAGHPEPFQKLGYLFGRNMALAYQAHKDQEIFNPGKTGPFSLVCAPLLFHIQHDPSYHKKIMEYAERDNVDFYDIRKVVLSGPGLKKTAELQEELSLNALQVLEDFPESDARTALSNIINSM
ncbi:hypothetical protein NQ314_011274 [Rhamnusium bicolor]|uniref:Decaprenyl-diphosphate synthase subunit 2 n=1 Tax=Rhamnusium bicolor TaxID=1586634 RepID=A0AAV8XK98_9CUCU|nr:hypothetical protein NQ314_011274 [Rhamnusium bicolor]